MNLEKPIAISGRSGLYRMTANRSNGLLVQDLHDGSQFFVSGRLHQFTPLESISIYTTSEEATVELKKVFENMLAQLETLPPVSQNAAPKEIRAYFEQILPEHDRDKVMISDIKKILKWFAFLHEHKLLN